MIRITEGQARMLADLAHVCGPIKIEGHAGELPLVVVCDRVYKLLPSGAMMSVCEAA